MHCGLVRLSICALAILGASLPAGAQATRDEWLAMRQVKEQERTLAAAGAAAPTFTNAITLLSVRFFSDSAGRLVGVGEARNTSTVTISYARLGFVYYDAAGSYLGSEQAYLHGGANKRVLANGLHTNVLAPGETGFFKVWTMLPAASMASYVVGSGGEDYQIDFPVSPVSPSLVDFPHLAGQRYSGSLWQTPAGMARFSRVPSAPAVRS